MTLRVDSSCTKQRLPLKARSTSGAKSLEKVFDGSVSSKANWAEPKLALSKQHPLLVWATEIIRDHPEIADKLAVAFEGFRQAAAMFKQANNSFHTALKALSEDVHPITVCGNFKCINLTS